MKRPEFLQPAFAAWDGLSVQERKLVTAVALVIGLFLLYLMLWAPMQRELTRLRVAVPQDRAKLIVMRAQAVQAQQLRAQLPSGNRGSGGLLSTIEQTANTRGLRPSIGRIEPEGQTGARVFFDEVGFNELSAWLADLQAQGIRVESATLQRRPAAGIVNARILLRIPA